MRAERGSHGTGADVQRTPLCVGIATTGHRIRDGGGEPAPPGGVGVDDRYPGPSASEQGGLRREVGLHGRVEVKMVLAEVGEGRAREPDPTDPVQGDGVAGDLHRRRGNALFDHDREQPLQVGRLRGGAHRRDRSTGHQRRDGAEQPRCVAGGTQPGLQQVCHGCLAVCSGDTQQCQGP